MTCSQPSSTAGTAWGYPCCRLLQIFPLRCLINAYEKCLIGSLRIVGLPQGGEWFRSAWCVLPTSSFTTFSFPLLWRWLWKTTFFWPIILNRPGAQTTQGGKWGWTAKGRDAGRALVHRYTTAVTISQTWISVWYHSCSFNNTESAPPVKILVIYSKRGFLPLTPTLTTD